MGSDPISQTTLHDLFGKEAADQIVERVGGWSVYVPVEHQLLTALGPGLFAGMVRHFGGRSVCLPSPPRDTKKEKIVTLLERGVSVLEITRRLNVSGRWVQAVKKQLRR